MSERIQKPWRNRSTASLCLSAIIAALYAALTLLLAPISYGNIQCRISEALTLLPVVFPEAIPGLFIGCLIANIYTGSILDIIFGSLATLIAAIGTYLLRKKIILAALCPVITNGLIVGAVLSKSFGLPLWLTMLQVAAGETVAAVLGILLIKVLKHFDIGKYFTRK